GAGRIHVRHQVDLPDRLPQLVGCFDATAAADAGVRAEQVDRPELALGVLHDVADIGFDAHVGGQAERDAAELLAQGVDAVRITVDDDDAPRAFGRELPAQRPPDPVGAAGDDGDLAAQLHAPDRSA